LIILAETVNPVRTVDPKIGPARGAPFSGLGVVVLRVTGDLKALFKCLTLKLLKNIVV